MPKQTASPSKLKTPRPRGPRGKPQLAPVVDLATARLGRKRQLAERRVRSVLDDNRGALSRLFATGLIFTQKGSRAARELLGAHQALLKVADVFARMNDGDESPGLRLKLRGEDLFVHLEAQLARTASLTARTGEFLLGRSRE